MRRKQLFIFSFLILSVGFISSCGDSIDPEASAMHLMNNEWTSDDCSSESSIVFTDGSDKGLGDIETEGTGTIFLNNCGGSCTSTLLFTYRINDGGNLYIASFNYDDEGYDNGCSVDALSGTYVEDADGNYAHIHTETNSFRLLDMEFTRN